MKSLFKPGEAPPREAPPQEAPPREAPVPGEAPPGEAPSETLTIIQSSQDSVIRLPF